MKRKFTEIYNYDGIIRYVEALTEKKLAVPIWTNDANGNSITSDAYVMGYTSIIRDDEEKEVVMVSLTGKLEDCFGMPFLSFVHHSGVPVELNELYKGCFNFM